MRSRLVGLSWVEGGALTVRCIVSVYHSEVLTAPQRHHLDLVRVDGAGGTSPRFRHEALRDAETVGSKEWYTVVASVDVRALVEATGRAPHGSWAVHPGADSGAVAVESRLHHRTGRSLVAALGPQVVSEALVRVEWSEVNGIVVDVRNRYAFLVRAESGTDGPELEVEVRGVRGVDRIYVGEVPVMVRVVKATPEGAVRLRVPTDALPRSGLVRVASASVSAPLLALSTKPPVLDGDCPVTFDRRGRVVLSSSSKPEDRANEEDLLLRTRPSE
jgi:hypothetical protein